MCFLSGSQASTDAQANASSAAAFQTQMQQAFKQQFGESSAITGALTKAFLPTLQAGPDQYGYTPGEDAALRTQSEDATAQAADQAEQAYGAETAGSDSTGLPSGAAAQVKGDILSGAAEENAAQQGNITQTGYEQGRQNYLNAARALSGTAALENPLGYAGETNQATGENTSAIREEAATQTNPLSSILGGLAGIALAPVTGGGSLLGNALGGLFGSKKAAPATPGTLV